MATSLPWRETVYSVFDAAADPSTVEPLPAPPTRPPTILGITEMHLQDALAGGSVTFGTVGLVAEAINAPPSVSWTCVALALVSLGALVVRATYSYSMRRIESRERIMMIEKGLTPPPLPPFGSMASPPDVPSEKG